MQESVLLGVKILFSCQEFSALTGSSLRTTAKLVATRKLDSIRLGRRRLIPKSALLRFVERNYSTHSVPRKKVGR
jgi:excisionase family DNA binding protein